MGGFEQAHYYIKDVMETVVLNTVKYINGMDKNMKLVISGGDVLTRYFDGPSIFMTHDYDIKLVVDASVDLEKVDKNVIYVYHTEIVDIFTRNLNRFYTNNKSTIDNTLLNKYGLKFIPGDKPFRNIRANKSLRNVVYTLNDGKRKVQDELIDIWIALPETLKFDYYTFIDSDPILSLDAGSKYYIPTIEVEGFLIAGLGFVLWDTQRMIEYSKRKEAQGLPNKLQRYMNKQKAIYNDLNHPLKRMSCLPFEDFVRKCMETSKICTLDGQKFEDVAKLLVYAQERKYLSKNHIKEIERGKYSLAYVCEYIKRLKEF